MEPSAGINEELMKHWLIESLTDYVDKSLKELQSINENAIMWTVQQFTDWNKKEGPRVMRLKADKVPGWRSEGRKQIQAAQA